MKTLISHVNKESFQREAHGSAGLVVVDLYADWCSPCRAIAASLNELAEKYEGRLEVKKINIDENPELTAELGVQSIPTLIFFRYGKEVKRVVGARPKEALESEFLSLQN